MLNPAGTPLPAPPRARSPCGLLNILQTAHHLNPVRSGISRKQALNTTNLNSQGFEAREAAVDAIAEHCSAEECSISFTVMDSSMFFKDADRMYSSMARRGTASALGDGFNRRINPIHGADLACRSA